jgi:hypothetical protein
MGQMRLGVERFPSLCQAWPRERSKEIVKWVLDTVRRGTTALNLTALTTESSSGDSGRSAVLLRGKLVVVVTSFGSILLVVESYPN